MGFGIFWTVELWQLLASPTVFTSPPKPRFLIRNMLDREVWFWGELTAAPVTRTIEGPDEDLFNVWGALFVLCSLVSALYGVLLGVFVDSLTAGVSRVSGAWICLSKTKILFLKYNRSSIMKQTWNVGVFQTKAVQLTRGKRLFSCFNTLRLFYHIIGHSSTFIGNIYCHA